MSIEFRCQQCLHLQKIDESKIGQQVYCRVCYFKLTVPAESTIKPIDESQLYSLDAKPWDMRDQHELISFPCDVCNTNIGVRKEQVGEEIICPECGTKIIVPKSIATIAEARRKEKLDKVIELTRYKATYSLQDGTTVPTEDWSKRFRFLCRLCGTTLFATEEQVGTLVTCPDCETKTKVLPQTRKTETAPLPPTTFEGDTVYQIATPSSASSKKNPAPVEPVVPVVCRSCGTRMHAAESQIGQFKTCPDCGQQTKITAVPKPRKITTETTSADAYGLNNADEPAPRPARFFTSLTPALLRKRQNELESCRSLNRPPLPKRPLTERFFVPFGDPGTWLPLLSLVPVVPLGAIAISWAAGATEGGGIMGEEFFGFAIFAVSVGLLIFTVLVAVFCYFASFLVHFYDMTCSGMDEGEYRGEIAPFDYFIIGLWLFFFSFVAVLPGYFIGNFLYQSLGEPSFIYMMMRISHWFFFPICFLSSMEEGSMFAVLAKNTIASLFRLPFAWFRFYFLTGVLFALCDRGFFVAVSSDSTGSLFFVWTTLFFLLFAIQSLFYFRLLGRLAWLIEETDRQKRELEYEDE